MTPQEMQAELETRFTYHAPSGTQPERYDMIRKAALKFAEMVVEQTPPSREQSIALTKLDEVVMFANAAIARRER